MGNKLFFSYEEAQTRQKISALERNLLELSYMKYGTEIKVEDIPINFRGQEHFIHCIRNNTQHKEVLLLLHGYGGTGLFYFMMMKILSVRYQVYAIDLLGMGVSSRPAFKMENTEECIKYFTESIEKFREAVGIKNFIIGGHSFGAYIAAFYCLHYPGNVSRMMLFSPAGFTDDISSGGQGFAQRKNFKKVMFRTIYNKFWADKLSLSYMVQRYSWALSYNIKRIILNKFNVPKEVGSQIYYYLMETLRLPESSEKAIHHLFTPIVTAFIPLEKVIERDINIPIAVYYGDRDWMDQSGAKRLKQKRQNFDIFSVSNAGHQVILDNPEELAKDLILRY